MLEHPEPEVIEFFYRDDRPDANLMVVIDGRQVFYKVPRAKLFKACASGYVALAGMEQKRG